MIGYVTLGTNDIGRASAYFDALLGEFGAGRAMEMDRFIAWATPTGGPMLAIAIPFDEKTATVGNGVMVALAADSRDQVDAVYAKALQLGGTDEGEPGPRGEGGFYAAYFRDLDGNKFAVFNMG